MGAILGRSPKLLRALAMADRYARSEHPVLLVGETGTGKELLAQRIHRMSGRPGELVDVNCGALPREMVESLLFGHVRGAFTGAYTGATGLLTRASRGTLFLDELTSLPLEAQAKLLRVLETGEVRPLGDGAKRRVEFRTIAAAQADLPMLIQSGALRRDLYFRVAALVITLPPLRERPEDIVLLAKHFAAGHGLALDRAGEALLRRYNWPGNVRELRAVIARAGFAASDEALGPGVLGEAIESLAGLPEPLTVRRAEPRPRGAVSDDIDAEALLALCVEAEWDAERIRAALGVSRATCYRRLKAAGIVLRRGAKAQSAQEARRPPSHSRGAVGEILTSA